MQTYGQNAQFKIETLPLQQASIETVRNLPVGGYTINDLSNYSTSGLVDLKFKLETAQFDVGLASASFTNVDLGILPGLLNTSTGNANLPLKNFLDEIGKDIISSINNVNIKLNTPSNAQVTTPTKPKISVEGIDFGNIIIGTSSTLSITINNIGDAELKITGYTGLKGPIFSEYRWPDINTETPLIIPVGGTKKLDIQYAPNGIYPISESVKFISNSDGGTNTAVIKGNSIPKPDSGVNSILGKLKGSTKRILTIKNIREVAYAGKNNPDIISPYFDQQVTTSRAQIVVDIWQCYTPFGQDKQIQRLLLSDVVIAKGIGSFWFEKCDDFLGGLRPSYQYFYDIKDIENILEWTPLVREQGEIFSNVATNSTANSDNLLGQQNEGLLGSQLEQFKKVKEFLNKIKEELDGDISYWGKFDSKNPNSTLCVKGTDTDSVYLSNVVSSKFKSKPNIKLYGGFSENIQLRSNSITDVKLPDLLSSIEGPAKEEIQLGFISSKAYGRLNCLQPRTGCYITAEKPLNSNQDVRTYGNEIKKLISKSNIPEKIPNHPCYRGFNTIYVRGFNWQRRWEVQLNCLGILYPEYEWRNDETLFMENATIYNVWEDVEFAGTEIGFNEICIPIEVPREQEPYVDMTDATGCYELQTTKIYLKYPDYNSSSDKDFLRGPETLSTTDYSGLGPGIKLNRKIKRADCDDSPVRIYHPLNLGSDIIAGRDNLITRGLFDGLQSPNLYSTSSYQNENSKKYYYQIVDQSNIKNSKPISYFSVAYGNKNGSGSVYDGYEQNDSSTKAIYSQNRLLTLDYPETEFKFYNNGILSSGRKDIYVLNFNRDSLTDRLDAGNFEINLKDFGSSNVMSFIDNSGDLLETKFSNDYVYSSFDIVSGSLSNGIHNSGTGSIDTNPQITTYGKVYPGLGIIIFDAEKLDNELAFNTNLSENTETNNALKIFTSISGAAYIGHHIKARGSNNKKSNHYFIRVSAGTSNYSNNPTMVNETLTNNNIIKHEFFKYNPITYITTIGLYNNAEELLAVAKLSKPVLKTPDKDILIKIRLNW